MKLISKIYLLLILLIASLSVNFAQGFYYDQYRPDSLIPILRQDTLKLNTISLLNYYTDFVNLQKVAFQDNPTIIDSILTHGATGSKGKRTFTYDKTGRVTSYLMQYLHNSGWLNSIKVTNTYDSSGNLLNILGQDWNGGLWQNSSLQTFSYNFAGNDTLQLLFLFEDYNWQNIIRVTKKYDSLGNMIETRAEQLIDNSWIKTLKMSLHYYPNGMRDFNLLELWNGSNWENEILLTFKYTNDWVLLLHLYKIWDGNNWNNNNQTRFTYSFDEPQLTGLNQVWDNSQWIVNSRYSYSYNANGYFTHGIYELWEQGNWLPYDGGIMRIENPDGFIHYLWTYEAFVYYGKPTSVDEEGHFHLKNFELSQNYPNPFNPSTAINYSINNPEFVTLKVYDVLGNEVATLVSEEKPAGSYEVEFNGSNLASGIYIYRLTSGNYTASKKLVLLK